MFRFCSRLDQIEFQKILRQLKRNTEKNVVENIFEFFFQNHLKPMQKTMSSKSEQKNLLFRFRFLKTCVLMCSAPLNPPFPEGLQPPQTLPVVPPPGRWHFCVESSYSQLVIRYHWLTFLNQVRKNLSSPRNLKCKFC